MGIEVTLDDIAPIPKSEPSPKAVAALSNIEVLLDENVLFRGKDEESDTADETDDGHDDGEYADEASLPLNSADNGSGSDSSGFDGIQDEEHSDEDVPLDSGENEIESDSPCLGDLQDGENTDKDGSSPHSEESESGSDSSSFDDIQDGELPGQETPREPTQPLPTQKTGAKVTKDSTTLKFDRDGEEAVASAELNGDGIVHDGDETNGETPKDTEDEAASLIATDKHSMLQLPKPQQLRNWLCHPDQQSRLKDAEHDEDILDDISTQNSLVLERGLEPHRSRRQPQQSWLCYPYQQTQLASESDLGANLRSITVITNRANPQELQQHPNSQPRLSRPRTMYRSRWIPTHHGGQWAREARSNDQLPEERSEDQHQRPLRSRSVEKKRREEGREEDNNDGVESRPNQDDTVRVDIDCSPLKASQNITTQSEASPSAPEIETPTGMDGVMSFLRAIQLSEEQYPSTMGEEEVKVGESNDNASGKEETKMKLQCIEEVEEDKSLATSKMEAKLMAIKDIDEMQDGNITGRKDELKTSKVSTATTTKTTNSTVASDLKNQFISNVTASRSEICPLKSCVMIKSNMDNEVKANSKNNNKKCTVTKHVAFKMASNALPALMDDVSALQDDDSLANILDAEDDFSDDVEMKSSCNGPSVLFAQFTCHGNS